MQLIQRFRQIRFDVRWLPKMFLNILSLKRKYPNMQVLTYKALVKRVEKRNEVCHIIATGLSAIDAYKAGAVQKDDYIIGFNYAAFLPYQFDIYLFEEIFETYGHHPERAKGIVELLCKKGDRISNLIYKNTRATSTGRMKKMLPDINFSVVPDRQLMYVNIKRLFAKPFILMPQYSSSVITATMLAYHAGFGNIIIHGLDFFGPHIYHDKDVQEEAGMIAPTPYVSGETKHVTASAQELIWPDLIKTFKEKGINIYCASPKSNFRKYADVWNND